MLLWAKREKIKVLLNLGGRRPDFDGCMSRFLVLEEPEAKNKSTVLVFFVLKQLKQNKTGIGKTYKAVISIHQLLIYSEQSGKSLRIKGHLSCLNQRTMIQLCRAGLGFLFSKKRLRTTILPAEP